MLLDQGFTQDLLHAAKLLVELSPLLPDDPAPDAPAPPLSLAERRLVLEALSGRGAPDLLALMQPPQPPISIPRRPIVKAAQADPPPPPMPIKRRAITPPTAPKTGFFA